MPTSNLHQTGFGSSRPQGHSGRAAHGKARRYKGKRRGESNVDALKNQPLGAAEGTVPCRICGHLVDPKRMHAHMVRFHGAARKAGAPGPPG